MIGRVYKIVCMVNDDIVYIGSTMDSLEVRWMNHMNHYKEYKRGLHGCVSIFPYFDIYSIEYFEIVLIKEYEVIDEKHLQAREQLWISSTNCVNQYNSFSIKKLNDIYYLTNNKEKRKQTCIDYYNKNKTKLSSKITCECSSIVNCSSMSAHRRTAKHLRLIAEL